jgi:nucleolar MIF4G domain-containing protein 1
MARYNEFAGPKLPTQLLEKVYGGRVDKHGKQESSRKEKRKAERLAKKKVPLRTKKPVKWQAAAKKAVESEEGSESGEDIKQKSSKSAVPAKDAKPVKSILKRRASPVVEAVKAQEENDSEEETDIDEHIGGEDGEFNEDIGYEDEDEEDNAMNMDDYTVSRSAAKAKLGDDDANIAALEKLLGMKGKKSKKVTDDDWDFLVNGDDGEDDMDEEEVVQSNGKRKRGDVSGKSAADDEWLESKRKKAKGVEKKGKGVCSVLVVEHDDK